MDGKRVLKGVAVAAGVTAGAMVGMANLLYDALLVPTSPVSVRRLFEQDAVAMARPVGTTGLDADAQAWQEHRARALDWLDHGTYEELASRAPDGPVLRARLYPAEEPTYRYAVICHGYVGSPKNLAGTALRFHDEGWNVLMPWMRAHGQSEGKSLTVGAKESQDILDWVRRLVNRDPDAEILVFGSSMGGATVMQLAGLKLPSSVRAIVSDCGFSSVRELMREKFGPAIVPELPLIDLTCRLRGGFALDDVNAVEAVSHATVPMLFIHGAEDQFIPPAMLDEVYEACASPVRHRLLVPDATHAQSVTAHPTLYWDAMDAFIADAWHRANA